PGADAHLSFTVPGAVGAFLEALERFGTKTVGEVLAPAVQYAEHGFPMYEHMRRMLTIGESRSQFDLYPPGGTAVFYRGGQPPELGQLFTQPALAGTLRRLVDAEASSRGHRVAGIGAARERFYGDSDTAARAIAELLAPAYLHERAGLIRMDRAAPEAPVPGTIERRGAAAGAVMGARFGATAAEPAADGTTHIAVVDREGSMVALTPSGGVFRKSAFAPELGCTLSTRSEMFVLEDGHPNGLVPGKRPRTTLISYLICEGG